jgi:hypothetical protein
MGRVMTYGKKWAVTGAPAFANAAKAPFGNEEREAQTEKS